MPTQRSRLSPTVIRELARKVNANTIQAQRKSRSPWPSRLEKLQSWLLLLFGIAWIGLILAAPLLLVLLPFGLNYTVQWLTVGAWLLAASFIAIGLSSLTSWMVRFLVGETPSIGPLLAGLAISIVTCGSLFLLFEAGNNTIPSPLMLMVACVIAGIWVGWGIYRLCVEREKPLSRRIAFFLATMCWSVSCLVLYAVLRPAYLDHTVRPDQSVQSLSHVLSMVGWVAYLFSQNEHSAAQHVQRAKQTRTLFMVTCLILIFVIVLLLIR